MVRRLLFLHRG